MIPSLRTVDEFSHLAFDFIVIGGGTAGLAVAARLAESNTSYTIGVIEAGGVVQNDPDVDIPGHYGRSLGGPYDWKLETTPRRVSAVGFCRGPEERDDYDAWEALGNEGWGWDGLLPFFKRSETFHPPSQKTQNEHQISHDADTLGDSGPISISYPTDYSSSHSLWHRTLNGLGVQTNTAHLGAQTLVSGHASTLSTPRLLVDLTHWIIIVINGDKVATGVHLTHHGEEYTVSASREIILSAGSVKSPQILELSGIGNPEFLDRAGVPVKVESLHVGENLQEHIMLATIFEVDPSLANRDDLQKDEKLALAAQEQYAQTADGPLTVLPVSICYVPLAHFVPKDTLSSLHAEADQISEFDADKHDILTHRLNGNSKLGQIEYIFDLGNWNPYFQGEEGKKYGTMLQILQYPFSVGSIHIRPSHSGSSPAEQSPDIDPKYYEGTHGKLDMEVMKHCLQFVQKIVNAEPLSKIIHAPASPAAAAYNDDKLMEEWITQNTITDWHPVGTCAMGGRAGIEGGVVDERLRVYGVRGLRVVDASVMPLQVSAHIQATVYAIAEKAAHMIIEDARSVDMAQGDFWRQQTRL
ncbi:Dehydrogenase patE [Fusarium culmorum]|uniref:Dehydrogenase patE n=1 Tax=Fusarium culmorum TaxID=5516 RepID=A0A2T4GVZ4_FUSCU|nr:Dehydrogenase patE [Fusarium culmorum]